VLVVTRGGTLRCFRYILQGWTYQRFEEAFHTDSAANCSVTWYAYEPGAEKLVLRGCNEIFWTPDDAIAVSPSVQRDDGS
jgi:hypothetical protein